LNALRVETQWSAAERLSRFDDIEFNENLKPFVYKCREHVLEVAIVPSRLSIEMITRNLQSSALSFLTVKKENTKWHSSNLEHFIRPGLVDG